MIERDFAAYVQGLPPQDRLTVEQALHGLREALARDLSERDEALVLLDHFALGHPPLARA